jgi:hypothetical protein
VPDHSNFSRARHGHLRDGDVFRHVFETVVRRAIKEGLVGGVGFAVDASPIAADATNKQRFVLPRLIDNGPCCQNGGLTANQSAGNPPSLKYANSVQ